LPNPLGEYTDGERVPIRLVQENGQFIELDATSIDIVVERIQSNFGIPFMSAKKFSIDLNQAAVAFEVQGVFADESGQEQSFGATAKVDFHQAQSVLVPKGGQSGKGQKGGKGQSEEAGGTYTQVGASSEEQNAALVSSRARQTSHWLYADWHGRYIRFPVGYWASLVISETPPDVTNLILQVDASQMDNHVATGVPLVHGDTLSSLTNLAGTQELEAQGTPIYRQHGAGGMPFLWFHGTNDYFRSEEGAFNFSNDSVTIFTVAHTEDDNGALQSVYAARDGSDAGFIAGHDMTSSNNRGKTYYYNSGSDGSVTSTTGGVTMKNPVMLCTTIQGGGTSSNDIVKLYQDGILKDTDTSKPWDQPVDVRHYIGGYGASYDFSGRIYEVLVYDGFVSDARRRLIEGYLSNKYNIPLPSTAQALHPYRGSHYASDSTYLDVVFDAGRTSSKQEPYGYLNTMRDTGITVTSAVSPTSTSCTLSGNLEEWMEVSTTDRPYIIGFHDANDNHRFDVTVDSLPSTSSVTFHHTGTDVPAVGYKVYIAPDYTLPTCSQYGQPVLVLPLNNAGDDTVTGGPTYPNYEDGTTRFASTALSTLNTTVTRTDEYIAYTMAQLLSHSSVNTGTRPVNAAGNTTMDKVFTTSVSTSNNGDQARLNITQVFETPLGTLGYGAHQIRHTLPANRTPLLQGFTGGKAGKKVKSAGDKVQDVLGILANSQNIEPSHAGTVGNFIDTISDVITEEIYSDALSGDYITAIQIPYNSLITLGKDTDGLDSNVAQRNFFLTTGNTNILEKTSVANTKHASLPYSPVSDASERNGINGIVTDFNVRRDAAMKAYEFSLKFIAADIII
jgi:hypothetical protein